MKIQSLLLNESVLSVLDHIYTTCESKQETCAKHLAVIMVMKDLDGQISEDHPIRKNTYIDYLYGSIGVSIQALTLFYNRIQQNPRARRLYQKYNDQFMDVGYGHVIMRNRIAKLRPYFEARRKARIDYHETKLIDNVSRIQDKQAAERKDQYDLTDGDKIRNDNTIA